MNATMYKNKSWFLKNCLKQSLEKVMSLIKNLCS
jgi:hypothetical protein